MSFELISTVCNNCNIDNCKSLQRIVQILSKYNELLYETDKSSNTILISEINELYKLYPTKNIINDYSHIKEMNYNLCVKNILCSQSLSECIPTCRHRRDNQSEHTQIYFTSDIKAILFQKILDQIHLFLYHPLSKDRKNTVEEFKGNRFGTSVEQLQDQNIKEQKYQIDEDDEKLEEVSRFSVDIDFEKDAYNFGQQFFYWKYYKNHKWYIEAKYNSLKDELLNNEICKIEQFDWDLEYENAVEKKEHDDKIKLLRSNDEFTKKYNIKSDIGITMKHLLSILFYCNTDQLQNMFSLTYRRNKLVNETDNEFKDRHSHYYYFAKLALATGEDSSLNEKPIYNEKVTKHGINARSMSVPKSLINIPSDTQDENMLLIPETHRRRSRSSADIDTYFADAMAGTIRSLQSLRKFGF